MNRAKRKEWLLAKIRELIDKLEWGKDEEQDQIWLDSYREEYEMIVTEEAKK